MRGEVVTLEAAHQIDGRYGDAKAHWADIDTLIAIKSAIDEPRHQEDTRVSGGYATRRMPSVSLVSAAFELREGR